VTATERSVPAPRGGPGESDRCPLCGSQWATVSDMRGTDAPTVACSSCRTPAGHGHPDQVAERAAWEARKEAERRAAVPRPTPETTLVYSDAHRSALERVAALEQRVAALEATLPEGRAVIKKR
jgi:hypothetical protein